MSKRKRRKTDRSRRRPSKRGGVCPPGLEGGFYRPLEQADIQRIHDAALTVLEQTGVQIEESECRFVLAKAGAQVDEISDRVFFPRALVVRALNAANRDVVLYSKNGETDIHLRGKKVHLGTGGAAVKVLDLQSGSIRESRLHDLYHIGRLVEYLDNIHFYLRPVVAQDVPNEDIDINTFYACLAATNKHVMGGCYYPSKVEDIKRMGVIIAGNEENFRRRPFLSLNLGYMVSPLRFATETVETLTNAVRSGLPVSLVSAPLSGATAPAALAGTLVQVIAEELAGLTYVQLLEPGHPILLGGMPLVADLRSGNMIGGSAEMALMNAASAQMCQFYDLPVYNSSALTDSKIPDVQAGFEKGMTTAVAALAGSQYIHHSAGMLESMLTVAYEQYIIDDEINAQAMRLLKGIEVDEASLSVEVIHEACLGEGHYLGHPQTLSLLEREYYYSRTSDRRSRRDWEAHGESDMWERARRKVGDILQNFHPEIFSPTVDLKLRDEFNICLPLSIMAVR